MIRTSLILMSLSLPTLAGASVFGLPPLEGPNPLPPRDLPEMPAPPSPDERPTPPRDDGTPDRATERPLRLLTPQELRERLEALPPMPIPARPA